MRILRVHNRYQERGGEDTVFEAEVELLRAHQHLVETLIVSNDAIAASRSPLTSVKLAAGTIWSPAGRALVANAVRQHRADIVHFDNTFPLLSPAVYGAARTAGATIVQTLHNFRLLCPNALFFRDGKTCEECLGKFVPYPAIQHGCYRGSRSQSTVVTAMLTTHRILHTWTRNVDRFIALNQFSRQKFIDGGIPGELVAVKPNFVELEVIHRPSRAEFFALYVGRLSTEKGIPTLLDAWKQHNDLPRVLLIGDGPLAAQVTDAAINHPGIQALGRLPRESVMAQLAAASLLVFPSSCYENFPVAIAEAFANAVPVVASRHGAMAEIVTDGVTGLLFEPGNALDLAEKIRWANAHPVEMRQMGEQARREYEAKYTPERNYELLMEIYDQAIAHRRADRR